MKLKDWADKQGIAYLTAWRWFKAGDPRLADAYQSDSGTIIVPDDSDALEQSMGAVQSSSDVMSMVLKKTVEVSKNNGSVEDFAAWVLSTFNLKLNTHSEGPKYSRVKPKPEDIQDHFKQFMKPKGEKPKPNMFVSNDPQALDDLVAKSDDLTTKELVEEIHKIGASAGATVNPTDTPEVEELMKDLSSAIASSAPSLDVSSISITNYDDLSEGIVTRSVDLTPQPIDYTGSTNYTFGTSLSSNDGMPPAPITGFIKFGDLTQTNSVAFHPTQKELESAARLSSTAVEKPRRGRRSLKGKK